MADAALTVTHPAVSIPGQIASVGAIIGSIAGWLPPLLGVLAAIVGTAFYAVMLFESKTVQSWLKGREFVRLKARQAETARILLRANAYQARALLAAQKAEAEALKAAQAVEQDIAST